MKRIGLLVALMLIVSCATTRHIKETDIKTDSTKIDVKTIYVEKLDTIYIELQQSEKEVVVRDTSSYLENKYAESYASISTDGFLTHNLKTKQVKVPTTVITKEIVKDSIVYQDRIEYKEIPIEINKPKTTFEKIEIYGFWILLIIVILYIVIKIKF